jgi:uncharacterized lipoprotein YmbA
VEDQPSALYYELDYPPPAAACPHGFYQAVRIRELSVFSPFDRREMVVEEGDRQVRISGGYQWVERPGRMVAERLVRDLSRGGLFPWVGDADNAPPQPLELVGRIEEFGWNRRQNAPRAVLQAEFNLIDPLAHALLLQRRYRLESPPSPVDDAAAFAGAMSRLVRELSKRLQQDLCEAAGAGRPESSEKSPEVPGGNGPSEPAS